MGKRGGRHPGCLLMTAGLLLIAAALLLTLNNLQEQEQAQTAATGALGRLMEALPAVQEEEGETLLLTDAQGVPLDWPLDAQGEPMPWPVDESGVPQARVTDGTGRVHEWAQLRADASAPLGITADAAVDVGRIEAPAPAASAQEEAPEGVTVEAGWAQASAPAVSAQVEAPAPAASSKEEAPEVAAIEADQIEASAPAASAQVEAPAPAASAKEEASEGAAIEANPAELPASALQEAPLSGWTVNGEGALLPWVMDASGNLTPWPTDSEGHALSWAQLQRAWSKLLDVLLPYLKQAASQPAFVRYPDMEMPTKEIDGETYIGVVEIPSLELSLPVMSDWSYPQLKKAPCRYVGSVYSHDAVICGHNYDRHFGRLKELVPGDEVRFTDMDGNVFRYSVCAVEQLAKTAVEEMQTGDWDLTLFTCTKGGVMRVTVRCALEGYTVAPEQEAPL